MKNLITIIDNKIDNQEIQTVNARELHEFLGSKQDYSDWIKNRINEYGFIKDKDFSIILWKTPNGGRPRNEYHISLNMAKELSMVERNEQGKEARQYFIKCEEIATNELILEQKSKTGLPEYRKAKATKMMMDTVSEIYALLPNLGEQSKQAILASMINPIAGNVIPLPVIDKTYTATEVGNILGVSSKKIGSIANKLEMKNSEYGIFVLDKSAYSNKQVESFRYNDKAVLRIERELQGVIDR